MQTSKYQSEVLENGYTIVRNALSVDELRFLRKTLINYFNHGDFIYLYGAKVRPYAFNSPLLKDILFILKKDSIANAIKQIAGERVQFCHHSDVHFNLSSGWHKDNYGSDDFSTTDDNETYGVYKVALYLQDHEGDDCALKVRKSSHLTSSLAEGNIENLHTKAGDAVIFDCRITHMGQEGFIPKSRIRSLIGRYFLKYGLRFAQSQQGKFELRRIYRKLSGMPDKLAIFFTYGKYNNFTDEHIERNVRRQNQQLNVEKSQTPKEVISNLQSIGIGY